MLVSLWVFSADRTCTILAVASSPHGLAFTRSKINCKTFKPLNAKPLPGGSNHTLQVTLTLAKCLVSSTSFGASYQQPRVKAVILREASIPVPSSSMSKPLRARIIYISWKQKAVCKQHAFLDCLNQG